MHGSRFATTTTRSPCRRARSVCLRRRAVHGVTPERSFAMSAFDTVALLRRDFKGRRGGAGKTPTGPGFASDETTADAAATHADPTRETPLTALTSAPAALQTWTIQKPLYHAGPRPPTPSCQRADWLRRVAACCMGVPSRVPGASCLVPGAVPGAGCRVRCLLSS
jgi:hypothetical protein